MISFITRIKSQRDEYIKLGWELISEVEIVYQRNIPKYVVILMKELTSDEELLPVEFAE